jgi:hypothetical protein
VQVDSILMRCGQDACGGRIFQPQLTWDKAEDPNRAHPWQMPELIARANQTILEAQWLRSQQRALRSEANVLASRLGETVVRCTTAKRELRQTIISLSEAPGGGRSSRFICDRTSQ